jgi:hypothetical protein
MHRTPAAVEAGDEQVGGGMGVGEAWVGGERPPRPADEAEAAERVGREAEQDLAQHVRGKQAFVCGDGKWSADLVPPPFIVVPSDRRRLHLAELLACCKGYVRSPTISDHRSSMLYLYVAWRRRDWFELVQPAEPFTLYESNTNSCRQLKSILSTSWTDDASHGRAAPDPATSPGRHPLPPPPRLPVVVAVTHL